ncbi:MAG: hypothetical protein ACE14V_06785 [bacterium]
MIFDDKYFTQFKFTPEQIAQNFKNALRDLTIAKQDTIIEVKYSYTYTALIKAGITLLSYHQVKVKSLPGHHQIIIDTMAKILEDDAIADIGNVMRSKRNTDLYGGGIEVTEKESSSYLAFVESVVSKIQNIIRQGG